MKRFFCSGPIRYVRRVSARGNARNKIFADDQDRENFLTVLGSVVKRYNWLCHAYCLMDSHYHLMIETPDANLSRGMRQLNGVYTQKYNWRHSRTGHIFQGRYKSILVEKENYLLELCRYVVLNRVRANMVENQRDGNGAAMEPPTHFHAKYADEEIVIEIESGKIIGGIMSKRALALVQEWREINKGELQRDWRLAEQKKALFPIKPLE